MRIPLSWLAEYVSLPANSTPETVMADLVRVGLEEEGAHYFEIEGPVVVGEVLEFVEEPQTNGKTIRWCQVRVAQDGQRAADGGEAVRGIVCGARNFFVGDKVVVTLPGAVLPGDFTIAARSTYGHTSDGMIASARELGLSDDHEGILRLSTLGIDVPVGTDALELLKLNDSAAEVNVTPDRGYCFSIRGIAREYSHATGASFTDPASQVVPVKPSGFDLTIEDASPIRGKLGASKFVVVAVNDLDATAPTPAWMISRLKLAGMRSISIVVDITNYVMLELGQPIHAYDLDKLQSGFGARRAKPNETLVTLDGQERKLDSEDYVIVDASGPIGLAGVMGGLSTEVTSETKNVLIEAANFDPVTISRSARRHKLPSEASKRFERGIDSRIAEFAAARVGVLLEELTGGKLSTTGEIYDTTLESEAIELPLAFATKLTGVNYSPEQIVETLRQIGCEVREQNDLLTVVRPSWRPDLTIPEALVEEVARILGYELIPSRLPIAPPGRGLTKKQRIRRLVSNSLTAQGFTEVLNYPFLEPNRNSDFYEEDTQRIRLANPLQAEVNELRLTLLPGLLEAASRNSSRTLVDLSLYEVGAVFREANSSSQVELPAVAAVPSAAQLKTLHDSVPSQPVMVAGLFLGDRVGQQVGKRSTKSGYAEAIGTIRALASLLSIEIQLEQVVTKGFHPGRTAAIRSGETLLGFAGEIHPDVTAGFDLPRQVSFFEMNLDLLTECVPNVVSAKAIFTYPAATQDLSLVIESSVPAQDVLNLIRESAGELLEEVVLVDDFRGGNLKDNEKSLTFALRFRASDRTLTQIEATQAKDSAVQAANARFGATIRS
ncbi:MAG: phenylalanine--tRNA ligase subunit beta [Rhodoluna sp.]